MNLQLILHSYTIKNTKVVKATNKNKKTSKYIYIAGRRMFNFSFDLGNKIIDREFIYA